MTPPLGEMFLNIAEGKTAQKAEDGSVSLYQGHNVVFLKTIEAEKLKRWFNEIL